MKNCLKIAILALIAVISLTFMACDFSGDSSSDAIIMGSNTDGFIRLEGTNDNITVNSVNMESKADSFALSEITDRKSVV